MRSPVCRPPLPGREPREGCPVSIDTSRAGVARRALALGATMVNDVTALRREPALAAGGAGAGGAPRPALARGATRVNDVPALRREPELAEVVAEAGARLCLMHMQGEPRTMQ